MAGPTPPANIVYTHKDWAAQFIHYSGLVPGASDFNKAVNPKARGNFLNGAVNPGDQTTFDYIDLSRSLKSGSASSLEFFVSSTAGTELLIVINPLVYINENEINEGYRKPPHRIFVPAGERIEYKLEVSNIRGFNIDYNGSFTGAGTPKVDMLVITAI